jgi:hypothetical protein
MQKRCWISFICLFLLAGCKDDEGGSSDGTQVTDGDAGGRVTCADLNCGDNAVCDSSGQDAECVCDEGYQGDGYECTDLDECADPSLNDCDPNAECTNQQGGYSCACPEGFLGDGLSCEDIDECEGATNICHPDASCVNTAPGFHCECNPGFTGDGLSCEDIDECADPEQYGCGENAVCVNTRGGFECECAVLFGEDEEGKCVPLCELALADPEVCDPNGRCRIDSDSGQAGCSDCVPPYVGDGKSCVFVQDCEDLSCGPNTVCVGNGTYICECAEGFEGDPNDQTDGCEDIDECADDPCDQDVSECLNTEGSYLCACDQGYELEEGDCVNIDECERGLDNCDPDAICTDQTPGFDCECKSGFSGTGLVCADIDECEEGTHDCNQDYVECVNTRGSYRCQCQEGFTGDLESCRCDLSGYWAMRQDATITWPEQWVGVPGEGTKTIDEGTLQTTVWELHRYEYDGQKLVVTKKGCGQDDSPDIYSPFFNETYSSYIPLTVMDPLPLFPGVDISLSAARPGDQFISPSEAAVVGMVMDDPLNDPLPAWPDPVPAGYWDDSEGDGEPGLTIWPVGTTVPTTSGSPPTYDYMPVDFTMNGVLTVAERAGCVSGGGRVITHLEGEVESCERLVGEVINEESEARIYSCTLAPEGDWDTENVNCGASDWSSATRCNADQVDFLDKQKQDNISSASFELVKIGELGDTGINCLKVREALPAISR